MADPISIISIVGTVVSAVGSIAGGISGAKASDYNAAVANQNAMIARNNAEYQALHGQDARMVRAGGRLLAFADRVLEYHTGYQSGDPALSVGSAPRKLITAHRASPRRAARSTCWNRPRAMPSLTDRSSNIRAKSGRPATRIRRRSTTCRRTRRSQAASSKASVSLPAARRTS